ncbi:MAG: STAS domain-containing protein [Deltaproteobacteria bacterium]|nr:STAS domain-containing protein [Deltaproteobacteria bacterium]
MSAPFASAHEAHVAVEPVTAAGEPPVATLFLEGELSREGLSGVGETLFRLVNRGCRKVVVDLSEVGHLDYRGVKPLVQRATLLRAAGGDIKLCGASPYVAAILRVAGAWQELELYPTRASALAAFRPGWA